MRCLEAGKVRPSTQAERNCVHPDMRARREGLSLLCGTMACDECSRHHKGTRSIYKLHWTLCEPLLFPTQELHPLSSTVCILMLFSIFPAQTLPLFQELKTFQIISSLILMTHLVTINKNDCKVFHNHKY